MTRSLHTHGPLREQPRVHRAWGVAAGTFLAIIGAGAFATMGGLLIEPLHHEFGWSRGATGVAVGLNMVLYGITAPFAAALMDRLGIRRVATGALLVLAAGAALTGTVTTQPWQLILFWGVLVGMGTGSLALTFAATVTQRWFVRRRGFISGILTSASVLGQFLLLPVLAAIVASVDWRAGVLALAGVAVIAMPFTWVLLRDHPADVGTTAYGASEITPRPAPTPHVARRAVRIVVDAAKTSAFWLLAGMFALCGASTNGVLWTHFVPAAHGHGIPTTIAATLLTVVGVFNLLGTTASGWLTDRFDPRWLLVAYFALRAVTLLLLPQLFASTVQPSLIAFAVVFGVLDLATVPPTIALCRDIYGDDGAVVFGWVNGAHQVGAALVAFLGGVARDTLGSYDAVFITTGVLCLVAAGACALISADPRPLPSAPASMREP